MAHVIGIKKQVTHEDGCVEAIPTKSEIETLRFLVNGQVDVRTLPPDVRRDLECTG